MSVLSEVARNLNEKIISGDFETDVSNISTRRLSVIPAGSTGHLKTPQGGRTPDARSVGSKHSLNKLGTAKTVHHSKSDLNNQIVNTTITVKSQHSADDAKMAQIRPMPKIRSVSSSSYLANERDSEMKVLTVGQLGGKQRARTLTTSFADSGDVKVKNNSNTSVVDSNKIQTEHTAKETQIKDNFDKETTDKDSDKIEMDEKIVEDNTKNEDDMEIVRKPRKPVLRKSKRIVRTDSEIFEENIIGRNEIVLKTNWEIQIHKEPDYFPGETHPRSTTSSCTTNESRKESSDIDDVCSPRDIHKSTDDSSRNQSTDELDTVFSDTTDLERLEREYRDLVRSNLQREYKSDGDTLDEVGKRRNDYLKWKNQSFENDFELYNENEIAGPSVSDSHQQLRAEYSRVCSPQSHGTITSNSSGNSSTKHTDENKYAGSSRASDGSRDTKKSSSVKESDTSTLTSPIKLVSNSSNNQTAAVVKSSAPGSLRPSKLNVSQSVPKENPITTLFEKRFGKFKKMNKLLKCKRFSTSALYDKKKIIDADEKKTVIENTTKSKGESCSRLFGSRFSPCKSSSGESKQSVYSSKLSLFNPKTAKQAFFFTKKSSAMYSNSSRSNTELNVIPSTRSKYAETSKSNSEINKFKCSPSRINSKKSLKENKNNSTACLYKEPRQSPLSEEFYNKTGSVRLSAMELYEKFCSEDFGGLYKHEAIKNEDGREGSCGGYKTWHEYRLGHKGLGAVKKFAQTKHARLLRQKSEPKFSFKGDVNAKRDSYFPEEEDEDIYEEDGYDHDAYYDEYGDEYEDEEGDYYEDEEGEIEDEEGEEDIEDEDDDEIEDGDEDPPPDIGEAEDKLITAVVLSETQENEAIVYHSEIEYDQHLDIVAATDSEVDEIFLMPASEICSEAYEKCGFENKKFSLEQSMLRKSNSMEHRVQYPERYAGVKTHYSPDEEIKEFGSDEILTIYKICSKDDMLNISDVVIHKPDIHGTTPDQENAPSSLEYAVSEYLKNVSVDIEVEIQSPYGADCLNIERSDSMEIFSSSSGTLHSGSTLTEYAFDTVRNLKLDSCSTSKLSLSLKSEIFDDFTLTPDEPKIVQNCVFEDFTLTPDGSCSETTECYVQSTLTTDAAQNVSISHSKDVGEPDSLSASSNDVLMIVNTFLTNERELEPLITKDSDISQTLPANEIIEIDSLQATVVTERQVLDPLLSPLASGSQIKDIDVLRSPLPSISQTDSELSPYLLDESGTKFILFDQDVESTKNVISDFTTEITKEFDLLFSRAKQSIEETHQDNSNDINQTDDANPFNSICCDDNDIALPKMSTRYSMQRLEPYFISDSPARKNSHQLINHSTINSSEYSKVLDVQNESSIIHKKVMSKLKSNRSQSLGNLSNKTRCFPL